MKRIVILAGLAAVLACSTADEVFRPLKEGNCSLVSG